MNMVTTKIIAGPALDIFSPLTFKRIGDLNALLKNFELKALYVHEFQYHPDPRYLKVRRVEEHGSADVPACPGVVPQGLFDQHTQQLLEQTGFISRENGDLCVQMKFDEQLGSFIQSELKHHFDIHTMEHIFRALKGTRRHYRLITTDDPMAQTLFDMGVHIVSGNKHSDKNYKLRVGRYILSFVPLRENLSQAELFTLFQLVQGNFLDIQRRWLKRMMMQLSEELTTQFMTKEVRRTLSMIDTQLPLNDAHHVMLYALHEIIRAGVTYCDLKSGWINLIPTDGSMMPAAEGSLFQDHQMTIKFTVSRGNDQVFLSVGPLADAAHMPRTLKAHEDPYKQNLYTEMFLVTPGLKCELFLESDSHHNLDWDGPNCSDDYIHLMKIILGNVISSAVLKKQAAEMERLANTDSLTGLNNKQAYKKRIEAEYPYGPYDQDELGKNIGLVLFDLDKFKPLNDLFGHTFPDHILTYVGNSIVQRIDQCARGDRAHNCMGVRWGGDEFLILTKGMPQEDITALAQALFEELTTQPIQATMTIRKQDRAAPFHVDMIGVLFTLLGTRTGGRKKRSRDSAAGSKRNSLFKRAMSLMQEQQGQSTLSMIKGRLGKIAADLGHGSELISTEEALQLLNTLFNLGTEDPVVRRTQEFIQETIVSFLKEHMLTEFKELFLFERKDIADAIEKFLNLQFKDIQDTNELREQMCSCLGFDRISFPLYLRMSMGIASSDEDESRSPESLFMLADSRMYQAKAKGRNRIYGIGDEFVAAGEDRS